MSFAGCNDNVLQLCSVREQVDVISVVVVGNGEKNRGVTASDGSAIQLVTAVRELAAEFSVCFRQSIGNDFACFLVGNDKRCSVNGLLCLLLDVKSNILLGHDLQCVK